MRAEVQIRVAAVDVVTTRIEAGRDGAIRPTLTAVCPTMPLTGGRLAGIRPG